MSTNKRRRTNMQLKHIAFNFKGWAINDPFPDHAEGQRMYVRLSGYNWTLAHLVGKGCVSESSLLGQSLELSPEEKGEVTVADSSISKFVIVGYALSDQKYASQERNPQLQLPVGTTIPPNIITKGHPLELFLGVCRLRPHQDSEPILYGVIGSGPGHRQAYRISTSRVFFRHESRSNEFHTQGSWLRNIANWCNATARRRTDFQTDRPIEVRPAPSIEPSGAHDDNPPRSALEAFFDKDCNITNTEAETIVNELMASQAWDPTYTIDSKEIRLLHQAFVGADTTIANNIDSRVDFFMTVVKRIKTLKSEQEQVNEILKDTMREVKMKEMAKEVSLMQNTVLQITQALEGVQM